MVFSPELPANWLIYPASPLFATGDNRKKKQKPAISGKQNRPNRSILLKSFNY